MTFKIATYLVCISALLLSCTEPIKNATELHEVAVIYPDYAGVTIPPNIAPLNFRLENTETESRLQLTFGKQTFEVSGKQGAFEIPTSKWKQMLQEAKGKSISFTLLTKKDGQWYSFIPFTMEVAETEIDPYIAYRLIEPGYELWNKMGIYQRDLESYTESAIIENKMTDRSCMNCHSFCNQSPEKMLFHLRGVHGYTLLIDGDKMEKLQTKTPETISPLVYPSWHPSGNYVAFSVNETMQAFHANDANRVEVFDRRSDVVVYDVKKNEIVSTPLLFSKEFCETFPSFSPDGKTLYFCTADARKQMPQEYSQVKYSLCSISFDAETRLFGNEVDTLYNAKADGRSASFPRVSPDGKYLLYTLSGYGNFSIWHKDADLYLIDLHSKISRPLDILNSNDVESYHSWSSNSRWVVFSSRREDGLYTRPYIAHIDQNGKESKPFLLPQKRTDYYDQEMRSFNIPEFITGKVKNQGYKVNRLVKDPTEKPINVTSQIN